jgi:PAS domain S-box-containing protein
MELQDKRIMRLISGIYIEMNPSGVIKAFSSFMTDDIGYSPDELCGKNWLDVFTIEEPGKTDRQGLHHSIFDDNQTKPLSKLQTRTGDTRYIEWSFEKVCKSNGEVLYILGVGQDISTHVAGNEELCQSHCRLVEKNRILKCQYKIAQMAVDDSRSFETTLQAIVDLIPYGFECPEKMVAGIRLNEDYYGISEFDALQNCFIKEIVVKGDVKGYVEVGCLEDDKTSSIQNDCTAEEKRLIDTVARKVAYIIERKEADEKKQQLEDQLRHADRLATIGQLAAGIAHELNNPLADILGFAQLASNYPDLPEQTYQDLFKIVKSTLYAREVIKKILLFSRQSHPHEGKVNLNQLIDDWLDFFQFRCQQNSIEIILELDQQLPTISGDPSQINQVIINLVVNAIHAMPDGGKLTIETGIENERVYLKVQDSGTGIDENIRDKIFLPFFTTKEVDQGTGLGLSVVYGIVQEHGGNITLESLTGEGTTFKIEFMKTINKH